jgi:hypothetical protein
MEPMGPASYDRAGCVGYMAGFAGAALLLMGGYGFYAMSAYGLRVWSRHAHAHWTAIESGLLFGALILGGAALIWVANRLLPPR